MNATERRLRKFVRYAGIYAGQAARRLMPGVTPDRELLVALPAGAGSLGDQAMLQSIADHVVQMNSSTLRQVLMPDWASFPIIGAESPRLRFSLEQVANQDPQLLAAVRNASAVVAIGADVIDGRYGIKPVKYELGMLTIAAKLGVPAALLGHSVSEDPNPEAMAMLAALPPSVAVFVRDPVSLQRFEKLTGRPASLVADLAFLVAPDTASRSYRHAAKWAGRQKQLDNIILCLNVNGLTADAQAGSNGAVGYWRNFLECVWRHHPQTSVLLLSHDTRSNSSDSAMHEQIVAGLSDRQRGAVYIADGLETAAVAKAIAALADVLLTGRMHLAIGALSLAVPTFCVAYAGKFEGLAQHVGIDDFVVPADCLPDPDRVAAWLTAKIPSLPSRRSALQAILPDVKTLALKNFSFLRN